MFEVVNNRLLLTAWSIQPETEQTPMGITLDSTKTIRTYLVTDKPLITVTTYSNRLGVGSPDRIESRPEVRRVFRPSAISVTFVGQQWEKAHIAGLTSGGRSYKNREDLPDWAVPLTYWENENIEERSAMPENEAVKNVKKGAAWLDVVRPGWFKKSRFNLDEFDIGSMKFCPLALAFNEPYNTVISTTLPTILDLAPQSNSHGAVVAMWDATASFCQNHGFARHFSALYTWEELDEAWREEVKTRRNQRKQNKVAP